MSSNLEKSKDPSLSPQEFKELLDLQDEYVYESLDLNDVARERYLSYLDTLPEVNYYPNEEDSDAEVLRKANRGDHRSQFQMAVKAMDSGDTAKVNEWFLRAAENGNILCAYNYALTLSSLDDKLFWFKKAGFKGMPAAQRELGIIYYEQGEIVRAKLWFGLAIRRENINALNDMGVLHYDRNELELAMQYWRQAADLGDQQAIDNLQIASEGSLISMDDIFNNGDFDSELESNFNDTSQSAQQTQAYEQRVIVNPSSTQKRSSIH
jgi:TPR repeat protein